MIVEVEEQDQEDQPIQTDDVEEDGELVGTVLHEEELADVSRDQHKLNLTQTEGSVLEKAWIRDGSISLEKASLPAGWWSCTSSTTGTSGRRVPWQKERSRST